MQHFPFSRSDSAYWNFNSVVDSKMREPEINCVNRDSGFLRNDSREQPRSFAPCLLSQTDRAVSLASPTPLTLMWNASLVLTQAVVVIEV